MKKFQYLVEDVKIWDEDRALPDPDRWQRRMVYHGVGQGWELVAVTPIDENLVRMTYKRESQA